MATTTLRAVAGTTTKGDILTDTGSALGRKAVGAASTILSADAAQADGLSWLANADFGFPPPLTGKYIDMRRHAPNTGQGSNAAIAANTLYGSPIWLRKGESLAAVSVAVTTAGGAGTLIRLGIYAYDPATGFAGALLKDAGTVPADGATGDKDATTGMPYVVASTGMHILAMVSDGVPTIKCIGGVSYALGSLAIATNSVNALFSRAFAFAALPDPFGGTPAFLSANPIPYLAVKMS